jgi:hypothetical protein
MSHDKIRKMFMFIQVDATRFSYEDSGKTTARSIKLDASYGEIGTCRYMCRLRAWLRRRDKRRIETLLIVDRQGQKQKRLELINPVTCAATAASAWLFNAGGEFDCHFGGVDGGLL